MYSGCCADRPCRLGTVGVFVCVVLISAASTAADAQDRLPLGPTYDLSERNALPLASPPQPGRRAVRTRARGASLLNLPPDGRFRTAFQGSAVGVTVGVGVGALLLAGASDNRGDRSVFRYDEDDPAATMAYFGAVAIVAGGPIGAVEGANFQKYRREAYIGAVAGELIGGGIGYALGQVLHDGDWLLGAAWALPGMALGAAYGAVLGARPEPRTALFSRRGDRWAVSVPTVRLRLPTGETGGTALGVTLLDVRL